MGKFIDLTGKRYGKLVVSERAENQVTHSGQIKVMWKCLCDCGNTKVVSASDLKSGRVNSCGCLRKELATKRNIKDISGEKFGKLTVVSFCKIENGRSLWNCQCECGTKYDDSLTIGRIDNNKGYSPENCRWVSVAEQNRKKTDTIAGGQTALA